MTEIRQLSQANIPALLENRRALFAEILPSAKPTKTDDIIKAKYFQEHMSGEYQDLFGFGIFVDEEMIASCYGNFNSDIRLMQLDHLYVKKEYRNKKYGGALLGKFVDFSEDLGAETLSVYAKLKKGNYAYEFYEGNGFTFKTKITRNTIEMTRQLNK